MKKILSFFFILWMLSACNPSFLDIKRESNQAIPSKVDDYLNMADTDLMYIRLGFQIGIFGSDDYSVGDGKLHTLSDPISRNAYLWADDVYENTQVLDWNNSYQRILYCNLIIEGLQKLNEQDDPKWRFAKGMALFYRACNFYALQQLFGQEYREATADQDLGIPIRLEADVSVHSKRATVATTYNQILDDLQAALPLLPDRSETKFRPGKQAVYAILAKVYLQMENYEKALKASEDCMGLEYNLIDFNVIDQASLTPFPADLNQNDEVILYGGMYAATILSSRYSIATEIKNLYQEGDLRKLIFFNESTDGRTLFKGSYMGHGSGSYFVGLGIDEILLIRAECLARLQRYQEASDVLNELLQHRFENGATYSIPHDENILTFILEERRRELIFRGTRWSDLRRLNKDARFAKTLIRQIDGKTYTLEPGSPRYAWPIPGDAVLYGNLIQNPR